MTTRSRCHKRAASAVALLLASALAYASETIVMTADCTVSCRIVTDPIPKARVGVDRCDIWNIGVKAASTLYYGGVVIPDGELPIKVGCLWNITIPDGETWWMTADWVRPDWQYSDNSNLLVLTSKKGAVQLLPSPDNFRVR